ncbi:MAG: hypothetical protein GY906_21410 [bacterium]|nr:hypothetical protein [bacterium]
MARMLRGKGVHVLHLSIVFAVCFLTPTTVQCNEIGTSVEVTVGTSSTAYNDDADWGWWDASKYEQWRTAQDTGIHVVDARLLLSGKTYTVLLGYEGYPTLSATASRTQPGGDIVSHSLKTDVDVFDLALARWFPIANDVGASPWIGVTRISIEESRFVMEGESGFAGPSRSASSTMWGAIIGVDVGARVSNRFAVSGRLVVRWASGTRTSEIDLPSSEVGFPVIQTVTAQDDTDQAMYGADIGLRWSATEYFHLEGGWRYRNWSYDNGFASFDGPFIRLVAAF